MKSKIEKIGIKSLIKETFKEEKVPSTGLIISTDISLQVQTGNGSITSVSSTTSSFGIPIKKLNTAAKLGVQAKIGTKQVQSRPANTLQGSLDLLETTSSHTKAQIENLLQKLYSLNQVK